MTDDLIFKTGNKLAGADSKVKVLALAAVKSNAVKTAAAVKI